MSTLAEIESAIDKLSPKELVSLERSIRAVRQRRPKTPQVSALDLPPLNLGVMLRPLTADDDLLDEMLDDTRF